MTWRLLTAGSLTSTGLVLTWFIQSTVLLAGGLLAGRTLRRFGPAVQSALYRTTLVAVILCPFASMTMAAMGYTGLLIRLPGGSANDEASIGPISPDRTRLHSHDNPDSSTERIIQDPNPAGGRQASLSTLPASHESDVAGDSPTPGEASRIAIPVKIDALPSRVRLISGVSALILAAWLLGTTVLAARLLVGHRRMASLRCSAIDAEPDVLAICRDLARQMRLSSPAVLRSPFLSSPCLDGLRSPAILLPEDAVENLRETFVHELAHLSRRDGLWSLLRQAATAILWVQPLLWLLSKGLEETAEEVCDDYVVEFGADRSRYAGHLLELAERRLPPLAPSGVGMISLRSLLARRITRILDSTRALSTRAGARAIAATLVAGLAGTLLVGLLGVGGGNRTVLGDELKVEKSSATDRHPATAAPDTSTSLRNTMVNGRVVDPDGNPVAGATVTAARYRRGGIGLFYNQFSERQELDRSRTDREGRFRLTFVDAIASDSEDAELAHPWSKPAIVAWAPDFGPSWPETLAREVTEDKPIRLVRDDVSINGRVVDLEGRPIAGATIRVHMVECPEGAEAVDRWLEEAGKDGVGGKPPRGHYFPTHSQLPGCEPAVSSPATTDGKGLFRLKGIGRDRLAILDVSGPSIAFRRVNVVTRRMKRMENPGSEGPPLFDRGYYGADGTIVVEPGRPIEGVVRDAETDEPILDAIVSASMLAGSVWGLDGLVTAVSDAQGRYRLVGLPKGDGHNLIVYPPLDRPYFVTGSLKAPGGAGLETVRYNIALHRGIWIKGRVTDGTTGQPVQAAIHYYPFLSNTLAQAFPNFQPNSISLHWTGSRYRTDADGRFRVIGLPGRGILAAKSFDRSYRLGIGADTVPERPSQQANRREALPTYNQIHPQDFNAMAGVNPPADAREFQHDLVLQPAPSLTVQVVDAEGKPLTHATVTGRFPPDRDFGDRNLYDQSRTQITGLDPALPRTVVLLHRDRKLGAVLVLKPGEVNDAAERTVTLRPCATVTGRIVDADGTPVTGGITVRLINPDDLNPPGPQLSEVSLPGQAIDADGRFRIDDLPPGGNYTLQARDRLYYRVKLEPEVYKAFELARNLHVGPGQVIDLGTFSTATGKPVKESEKATTEKAAHGKNPAGLMPITGRIVDLEGRPVAGVTVRVTQITKPKGDDLTPWIEAIKRGEPPWIAYNHLVYEPPISSQDKRPKTMTDAQGRFRFDDLAMERLVELAIQGPTIAFTPAEVITRRAEPIAARGFTSQHGPGSQTVYGADFRLTCSPGRPIEGVVRDARTKQPMTGVEVRSEQFAGSEYVGTKDIKTTTDAQGRFRLVGLPKGRGNRLLIVPNDDQPYFMQEVEVPDPPGIAPVPVEIALHKGIWIQGKVTEKETGNPVPGTWLHYFPFLENKFAQATPEFGPSREVDGTSYQDRYQSKVDGTYRLVGLPGRAIVGVVSHSEKPYLRGAGFESIKGMDQKGVLPTYFNPVYIGRFFPNSMKEINPPHGADAVHLDLELYPGARVRLRVVDPQGKPVVGVKAAGRNGRGEPDRIPQEAEFDVLNLTPGEDRMVMVQHGERKLGKAVHVHEGDDQKGPVTVTLEPLASIAGRVMDGDGNPVSGATVRADPHPQSSGGFNLSLGQVASDREGKFVVPDALTGCDYTLACQQNSTVKAANQTVFRDAKVRPGESTDVGEIRFKND